LGLKALAEFPSSGVSTGPGQYSIHPYLWSVFKLPFVASFCKVNLLMSTIPQDDLELFIGCIEALIKCI